MAKNKHRLLPGNFSLFLLALLLLSSAPWAVITLNVNTNAAPGGIQKTDVVTAQAMAFCNPACGNVQFTFTWGPPGGGSYILDGVPGTASGGGFVAPDRFYCNSYATCPAGAPPGFVLTVKAEDTHHNPLNPPVTTPVTINVIGAGANQPPTAQFTDPLAQPPPTYDSSATPAPKISFTLKVSDPDDEPDLVNSMVSVQDSNSNAVNWNYNNGNPQSSSPALTAALVDDPSVFPYYSYKFTLDCAKMPGNCKGGLQAGAAATDPHNANGQAALVFTDKAGGTGPSVSISTPLLPPNHAYPRGGPVPFTVSADDSNPLPPNGLTTTVTVSENGNMLASWDNITQRSQPPGALTVTPQYGPGPHGLFAFTLTCPPGSCNSALQVDAKAAETGPPSQSASDQLALPPGSQPPTLQVLPSPATPSDTIAANAKQVSGPKIFSQEYKWILVPPGGTPNAPVIDTIPVGPDGRSSSDTFACSPALCPGGSVLALTVTSILDAQGTRGGSANAIIQINNPPPAALQVIAFSPDDGGKLLPSLQTSHSATIDPAVAYTITFGPTDNLPLDSYNYHLLLNGNDASLQPPSNSGGTVSIDCAKFGCRGGDFLQLTATGIRAGASTPPLTVTLQLVSSSPSPFTGPNITGMCAGPSIWQYMTYMFAGLALMSVVIALVYMAGESLHLPHLLDWSKTEALQMGMAIVLFIVIAFLLSMECNLRMGEFLHWTGLGGSLITPDMNTLQASQAYLNWATEQTHLSVVLIRRDMGALNIRATYSKYESSPAGLGGNGYSSSPYSGDWTTLGTLGMLLNLNSSFLLAVLFEFFSLAFFASASGLFIFLVPIGLVLRSVPFLRQFGGSLVAIAVGFYIFYPLFLAMLGLMLPPLYAGHDARDAISGIDSISAAQTSEQKLTGDNVFSYFNSYPDVWIEHNGQPDLGIYFKLTALNFIRAIFLPSVGLIITVTFVRDLSGLFGEEVDASRLVQLV